MLLLFAIAVGYLLTERGEVLALGVGAVVIFAVAAMLPATVTPWAILDGAFALLAFNLAVFTRLIVNRPGNRAADT